MVSWRNNEFGEKEKTEIVHKTLPYIFYPLIAMFTHFQLATTLS